MTDTGSRRGAANLAPILMILSFVGMAGLLVWLGTTAEGTQPVAMEESGVDSVEAAATPVTREQLSASPEGLMGQTIRLEGVRVLTNVGRRAFMVELGEQSQSVPFLVVLDSTLVAGGQGVPQGTTTVVGSVRERTDSILNAWLESGIVHENERPIVEFASYFIDATRVRGQAAGGPGGGDGGSSEDGGA